MIKLIASDMDGTLLDGDRKLPPDFGEVYAALKERGIHFVIASGRSFVSLTEYFEQMHGTPGCICDNGAYVMDDGIVTDIRGIPRESLHRLLTACAELPALQLVLCGVKGTYFLPGNSEFNRIIINFYSNYVMVDDLLAVDDIIFKVGISDMDGPHRNSLPFLTKRLGNLLSMRISGSTWMDITDRDVTKGAALLRLQERLGITPEETMAFGDYFNDIELLANAGQSFVMENAVPEMRQYGKYLAKSNLQFGVTDTIKRHILNQA